MGSVLEVPGIPQSRADVRYPRGVRLIDDPHFRQIPVVMCHQFVDASSALGQIKDYVAWGYKGIFVSELYRYLATGDASQLPDKPVVITDDDGGLSSYLYLFPALQAYGMKATYYVVPDWIDGTITTPPNGGAFLEASAFSWANAVEMFTSGLVEFQSHTKSHGSMRLLSGAAQFNGNGEGAGTDFLAAKARIEAQVPGTLVEFNAAPYGVINETAIAALKASGCKGNRITNCGKDVNGVYDGSGPFAFTLFSTDPFRVPIADSGNFKYLRKANIFGEADAEANQFCNGKFLATQRGITLPTGWTLVSRTLPSGASPASGPVLRGAGTAAATGAYHTDMIPVGLWGQFNLDWWVASTGAPAASCRMALDVFASPADTTPVRTYTESNPIGGTTGWTRKRWYLTGESDFAWVRPRFEIVGATSGSEMLVWDVRLRRTRTAYPSPASTGVPAPVAGGGSSGPQSNYTATTDPTATSDSAAGYAVGSEWVNTTTKTFFKCVDATATAAVWQRRSADVKVYDTPGSYTWTKPAWCSTVTGSVIAGGGGGGGGRRTTSGTAASGGAGGGGGGWASQTYLASACGATESIVVGAGGTGGVAQTTNATNGANGGTAGVSVFGQKIRANPGGGGTGGNTGAAALGAAGGGISNGASGGAGAVGAVGAAGTLGIIGGAGGGAGGGLAATPSSNFSGGNGGAAQSLNTAAGGVGGTVDGASGGSGASATTGAAVGGSGGGGGSSSASAAGGAGGAGGNYGAGGGGGGCSLDGFASGAGGNGAPGLVVIVSQ